MFLKKTPLGGKRGRMEKGKREYILRQNVKRKERKSERESENRTKVK